MHLSPLPSAWRRRKDGGRSAPLVPGQWWMDVPPLGGGKVFLRLSSRRTRHPGLVVALLPPAVDAAAQDALLEAALGPSAEALRQAIKILLRLVPDPPGGGSSSVRLSGGRLRWTTLAGPQALRLPPALVSRLHALGGIGGRAFPWTIGPCPSPSSAHERLALQTSADHLLAAAGLGARTRASVLARLRQDGP